MRLPHAPAWLMLAAALLSLSGCGFHLRGAGGLPPGLESVYVQSVRPDAGVAVDLRRLLEFSGGKIAERPEDADAVVRILEDRLVRRILSVDADGRVTEEALLYRVRVSVAGPENRQLMAPQLVLLTREFVNDESNVLGTAQQAASLRQELQRDAAQQVMRRIDAGVRRAIAAGNQT